MKTELIKATELKAGDIIAMEYGDEGHFVEGIVISVAVKPVDWNPNFTVITFKYNNGSDMVYECCPDRNGNMDRVIA